MIRVMKWAAAAAACAIGTTVAHAHGPGYWVGPRHSYGYYAPYYYPYGYYGYYHPRPAWVYPPYARGPVIVERIYEPEPPAPPEVHRRYEERNYAQAAPPPPPPAPAPRFERHTLSAEELFGFDQATLRGPNAKLDEIAEALKGNPQISRVRITGYTDRLGSDSYNLKLSQRRAEAVKAYLVSKGVAAGRLSAVGKGKADPVVQCNEKDRARLIQCLEPNRRVEVEPITVERRQR
ncbi:MAG TPA: OmpA family protein [Usitatibacter sp.]|nr:OmpA family protein [Usitatibacter sp.]